MANERNWSIGPWTRYEKNERMEDVAIRGARITDRDTGIEYRATVGTGRGGAWLTHLSITVPADQRVNHDVLSRTPTKAIADAVAQNLRETAEADVDAVFTTKVRVPGDRPRLSELAAEHSQRTRQELADLYGVSPSTIDRWVAAARSAGLIGPATTGRPPTSKTSGSSRAGTSK